LSKVRAGILGAPHLDVIEGGAGSEKNAVPAVPGRKGRAAGGGGRADGDVDAPTPESTCPLVPLGHRDGQLVFLDVTGQERHISARSLGSRSDLTMLFLGDTSWLFRWFPKKKIEIKKTAEGEKVQEETVIGFQTSLASEKLMAMCGDAGLFGPHVVMRGPGVWADADGVPIVHAGDQVLAGGKWRKSGYRSGDQVWATAPATPRPGGLSKNGMPIDLGKPNFAAPASVAQGVQDTIRELWAFRHPGSEIVSIGLMGIGYYGQAASWRSNGYLIGGAGSGKSMLLNLLRACVPSHSYSTDTSKSGIEASINGKPTIAFIDEAGDRVGSGAQVLMDVVLSASNGDGTKGLRGTSDGKGREFSVLCNVIMATVNPPDMGPAIRDRFTIVHLLKPPAGADHRAAMEDATRQAQAVAPRLWGRAIEGWPRWTIARTAFRAALASVECAAREMDQMGAILASWWVLTQDGIPDENAALDGVAAVAAFIRGADEVVADDGPRRLVQFLASTTIQRDRSTDIEQIGVLVEQAFSKDTLEDGAGARRLLMRYGIRVIRGAELEDARGRPVPRAAQGDGIWFSQKAETLRGIFKGGPFEGDRWMTEMMRHASAKEWRRQNVRIGGVSGPAIWLSRSDWDPPDD
jgi:hypothetical protein